MKLIINIKKYFLSIFFIGVFNIVGQIPWSHMYKKILTKKDWCKNKKFFIYKQESKKMPFTQLIISWNATRPLHGYFLFKVRVRNSKTKKWDIWHDIAIWGNEQKSFFSRGKFSVFNYSRLELENNLEGDAFEILAYCYQGASLNELKGIFVAASHAHEFKEESSVEVVKGLDSCGIETPVLKSQMEIEHPKAHSLCSPTSVSIVIQMLANVFIDPLMTAYGVYDAGLDIFGNWAFNMAHAFDLLRGKFVCYAMRPSSFKEIYNYLQKNIPVAVSVRGSIKGGKKPYNNGHLLVVTGWNAKDKKVVCCDPAFDTVAQVKQEYEIAHFLSAWERSRRLTYIAEPML